MADLKVITLSSIKGGVGKTVSSVNIAACLAEINPDKNVILIDLDPSGNASSYLRYEPSVIDVGSRELFEEGYSFEECINDTFIDNLFIIPAEMSMKNIQIMASLGEIKYANPNNIIKEKLDKYRTIIDKDTFIVIDTHPDFDLFTLNALMCTDRVICPVEHCSFSLLGFEILMNTTGHIREKYNNKLRVMGLFKNNWDKVNSLAVKQLEENIGIYDKYVLNTVIPSSIVVEDSKLKKTPMVLLNKKHAVTKSYIALVEEMLNKWDVVIR